MDARTQNETFFTGAAVQNGIGNGRPILSLADNLRSQRESKASGDRDILEQRSTRLGAILSDLSPGERLLRFRSEIEGRLAFTTSFGLEDQVILHLLAERNIDVDVVTLDTGRLFSRRTNYGRRRNAATESAFAPSTRNNTLSKS